MKDREQSLCAVTFNIFYALRSRHVEHTILETCLRLKPDVIALQEAWEGRRRNFARDLAEKLGYRLSFAARASFFGRSIGLAMLFVHESAGSRRIFLPPHCSVLRPRILQIEVLIIGGAPWIIAHAHLESISSQKTRQLQLKAVIAELRSHDASLPVVLLGDFNTKNKKEVANFRMLLAEAGFSMPTPQLFYTWNIFGMRRQLDWIALRNGDFLDAGVLGHMKGSDHKPLWARMQSRTS